MQKHEKEEHALFQIGWSIVGILFVLYLIYKTFSISILPNATPCVAHTLLGIYCPGCGGTRAIAFMLKGQFWDSFVCHPLVLYTAVICGWFLISQTIERISKHKIKIALHYRDIYLWIALAIVTINFIVKNALLLIWHMDILAKYSL